MELNKTYCGDSLEILKTFPDNCVDVLVTSPPYWGLRDYGTGKWEGGEERCDHKGNPFRIKAGINKNCQTGKDGKNTEDTEPFKEVCGKCGAKRIDSQLGLEATPEKYVAKMVAVFRECKRVLKPTGTMWVNLGDSYAGSGKGAATHPETNGQWKQGTNKGTHEKTVHNFKSELLKPKDLIGIPWRVAFALQADGWYLRSDIIWNKPNPMPESVTDRPTKSHEYIFLLSKSQKYFYDAEAIKTESIEPDDDRGSRGNQKRKPTETISGIRNSGVYPKANKRSVWTVTTQPYREAHFATFPEDLIVPCIKAGSSEHGCCAECGKPWERVVKKKLIPTAKASFNSKADKRDFAADAQDQGSNRSKDGHKPGWAYQSETTGWQPTCNCNAGIVPSVVLDPFMGAGTTAVVARKLNRNFIGIELNPKYIAISQNRLRKEIGIFQ